MIRAGSVKVDDVQALRADLKLPADARVELLGNSIAAPKPRYFMLHKPKGVVSVSRHSQHPTAIDLLADQPRGGDLQIAGRLDLDASGLLLITDDGKWNHALTAPNRGCSKTYRVQLAEPLTAAAAEHMATKFAKGVWLDSERRKTRPATLNWQAAAELRITLSEGRYHQVKRMFAAEGNRVLALHRERVGGIDLDANLQPGQYRALTAAEINSIWEADRR